MVKRLFWTYNEHNFDKLADDLQSVNLPFVSGKTNGGKLWIAVNIDSRYAELLARQNQVSLSKSNDEGLPINLKAYKL